MAGVIWLGSSGKVLSIDCRICLDCRGGDAGGDVCVEGACGMLNYQIVSSKSTCRSRPSYSLLATDCSSPSIHFGHY